eukprot:TRINITY_DN65444_c0_g1_i1.p1 TRINITY_DN65444_c0_g1~~TRINITY_DN65444_c0_g1_i1.p1  ORF type:complete len:103 (+),score=19.00 TRINITY_DN65444_c0_g1_i1:121-429(+)
MCIRDRYQRRVRAIGNYVFFGTRTICEAMLVGNFVIIEADCIIGERCTLGHGCWLRAGTVVPSGQALIPFGAVSYTHLRDHETPEHLVCRLLLEKKKYSKCE